MAEKEVRKTTAKKSVRRTATKTVSARTTVRKTVAPSTRKAPTRITTTGKGRKPSKAVFAGIFLFMVLLGVSAVIGFSDKGQLNVENTIALRKQNATPEEQETFKTVPVQQSQNSAPNGGLVGMGQADVPPPVIETTTDSSTSTATSSSEINSEENTIIEANQDSTPDGGSTESTTTNSNSEVVQSAPVDVGQ